MIRVWLFVVLAVIWAAPAFAQTGVVVDSNGLAAEVDGAKLAVAQFPNGTRTSYQATILGKQRSLRMLFVVPAPTSNVDVEVWSSDEFADLERMSAPRLREEFVPGRYARPPREFSKRGKREPPDKESNPIACDRCNIQFVDLGELGDVGIDKSVRGSLVSEAQPDDRVLVVDLPEIRHERGRRSGKQPDVVRLPTVSIEFPATQTIDFETIAANIRGHVDFQLYLIGGGAYTLPYRNIVIPTSPTHLENIELADFQSFYDAELRRQTSEGEFILEWYWTLPRPRTSLIGMGGNRANIHYVPNRKALPSDQKRMYLTKSFIHGVNRGLETCAAWAPANVPDPLMVKLEPRNVGRVSPFVDRRFLRGIKATVANQPASLYARCVSEVFERSGINVGKPVTLELRVQTIKVANSRRSADFVVTRYHTLLSRKHASLLKVVAVLEPSQPFDKRAFVSRYLVMREYPRPPDPKTITSVRWIAFAP